MKIHPIRTTTCLLVLFMSFSVFAQYDETDPEIAKKKFVWGERVDETEKTFGKSNADIWYSEYTAPLPGYVVLKSGERIEGSLIKRRQFNKASFKPITVEGQKKADPSGRVNWEYHIEKEGKKEVYASKELEKYGLLYYVADYAAPDAFKQGKYLFEDGTDLEGLIHLVDYESKYEGLTFFKKAYYASDNNSLVIPVDLSNIIQAQHDKVGGAQLYYPFEGALVRPFEFKKAFSSNAKANKCLPLSKGAAVLSNGKVVSGQVAMDKRKRKRMAYFHSDEENLFLSLQSEELDKVRMEEGGKMNEYILFERELLTLDEIITEWKEKENYFSGKVILDDGKEITGNIAFSRDANVVKSYRLINGIYIIPQGSQSEVQFYKAYGDIDYALVEEQGKTMTYIPLGRIFVEKASYIAELEAKQSNNIEENLHPGYIQMMDGSQIKGRIAGGKKRIVLIDDENNILQFHAKKLNDINFYVQVIKDKNRKFIPSPKRSALEDAIIYVFVEVQSPDERFSYYKNPFPSHRRDGVTKMVGGVVSQGVEMAKEDYARNQGVKAKEAEMAKSGNENRATAAKKSAYGAARLEADQSVQVSKTDNGGIYYEEYVIIDNNNNAVVSVYKGNEEEILGDLLNACPAYSEQSDREKKLLLDANLMPKIMRFINGCEGYKH